MTLRKLQQQQRAWVRHNFPSRHDYYSLLGVVEELGELSHAHLKMRQGIRGTKAEHEAAAKDAVGDLVIFLADYCTAMGFDLEACVTETWREVRKRDWIADPKNGKKAVKNRRTG